ncbi:MAG: SDR family oxidoreductase [Clostridiales bacterium]|nr:SDR family oxidoreductase [Clostridiales bacterium]
MLALVTGASSGIGKEIAYSLAERGFDLILVARRLEVLIAIKHDIMGRHGVNVAVVKTDLADPEACKELYKKVSRFKINVLVNNAGFGVFGNFDETDLDSELELINVNIKAVHILTKLFLKDFKARNSGYILNVASSAGFFSGPMFSSYYASKNYVVRLTQAIHEELKNSKSRVYIGALCPGPVKTDFGRRAGVVFSVSGMNSKYVAEYALKKMLEGQVIIIPGILMKVGKIAGKILPEAITAKAVGNFQRRRHEKAMRIE